MAELTGPISTILVDSYWENYIFCIEPCVSHFSICSQYPVLFHLIPQILVASIYILLSYALLTIAYGKREKEGTLITGQRWIYSEYPMMEFCGWRQQQELNYSDSRKHRAESEPSPTPQNSSEQSRREIISQFGSSFSSSPGLVLNPVLRESSAFSIASNCLILLCSAI